jgi:hypothetical protein
MAKSQTAGGISSQNLENCIVTRKKQADTDMKMKVYAM